MKWRMVTYQVLIREGYKTEVVIRESDKIEVKFFTSFNLTLNTNFDIMTDKSLKFNAL